ncbi:hypothetical protein [Aureimonas psammosilenae]|uniref:hypothetical protein n=1 Tax=Aureimonas psammosilenae TaxID=2495496 RepID=UPI001260E1CF|nr:hypothetical protein [Aureimonas psammosilenae]
MTGKPNHPSSQKDQPTQPTHEVKQARWIGEKKTYDRIGAAWQREDGSIYIRLVGTQIVSEGFTLYPVEVAR